MNLCILYEFASVNFRLYFIYSAKIVMHTILLTLTWLTRCVTDGESKFTSGK